MCVSVVLSPASRRRRRERRERGELEKEMRARRAATRAEKWIIVGVWGEQPDGKIVACVADREAESRDARDTDSESSVRGSAKREEGRKILFPDRFDLETAGVGAVATTRAEAFASVESDVSLERGGGSAETTLRVDCEDDARRRATLERTREEA